MIKSLNNLKFKSYNYISNFLESCTIEEKLDAYYIKIDIRSKTNIIFIKSNGNEVDRCDLILNEMWQQLFNDWHYFRLVNNDWFEKHVGYKICLFYFPCDAPIFTKYKTDVSYVIDRIEYKSDIYSPEDLMNDMKILDKFNIKFKKNLIKNENIEDIINEIKKHENKDIDYEEEFKKIINLNKSYLFAENKPEGYIFKYGNSIYQSIEDKNFNRIAKAEKSQYEFLLIDFMKFMDTHMNLILSENYIKTVCLLFNSYIEYEKETNHIKDNINTDSLLSPCIGKRFDICYTNIPDQITINLCKESDLYKNIFKILLVNLRRKKSVKHCILMMKRNIDKWNDIVQIIKNSSI
jgi:hypothetical protein